MAMSDQDVQKQVLNILNIPTFLILQPVNLFVPQITQMSYWFPDNISIQSHVVFTLSCTVPIRNLLKGLRINSNFH